jgi:hypothetical protein
MPTTQPTWWLVDLLCFGGPAARFFSVAEVLAYWHRFADLILPRWPALGPRPFAELVSAQDPRRNAGDVLVELRGCSIALPVPDPGLCSEVSGQRGIVTPPRSRADVLAGLGEGS